MIADLLEKGKKKHAKIAQFSIWKKSEKIKVTGIAFLLEFAIIGNDVFLMHI